MKTLPDSLLTSLATVIRSRAPLRISFCGGGTDVPPYPERFGGCVLSCTIDKYAYVSVRHSKDARIHVVSEAPPIDVRFEPSGGKALEGKLDLAQAIFRRFSSESLDCYIHADAPPGSGLGSSSTMIVALIEAMARERSLHLTNYQKAELACQVERNDLGIIGGLQDQYAAAFGGFNFIEFDSSGVHVTPLRLPEETLSELHYHLLLCYTGTTRQSSAIIAEQTRNVVSQDETVMDSLSALKDLTAELKRALLRGNISHFGGLLDEAWMFKRRLASSITNDDIEELYEGAKRAGAIGGKILGAGGGGHLLLFAPFNRRGVVRRHLEERGVRVVDFQFEQHGSHSWMATGETWAAQEPEGVS